MKITARFETLLDNLFKYQLVAPKDLLNLLYRSIETGKATVDASIASLQEIQRNWN